MLTRFTQRLLIVTATAFSLAAFGQGVITTPRTPSPAASVSQTVGISTVTVNYSRPAVRGREIWGQLVPYGFNVDASFGAHNSAPWRAGANENTVITFSDDATVEGQPVPAGSYGLFFAVNEDNTAVVVLSKEYQSWGAFWYDPANDLMRATINTREIPMTEMLTYDFINVDRTSAELVLNWEKKQFPVKIQFDVDAIVLANAKRQLTNSTGFTWQGYNSAANYCLTNNVALDQGLAWATIAVQGNPNFTALRTKSAILAAMGKQADADAAMKQGMAVATEVELNNYGYLLLNQKDYDKAIDVLALNTQKHPESANTWDSLGEAYALKGDKPNAVKNFKKSLSLNPPDNVRANSEKYLKQLGATK